MTTTFGTGQTPVKVGDLRAGGTSSGARAYRALVYGDTPWHRALYAEIVSTLFGGLGGAAGLWLRSKLYRPLFAGAGAGVLFGRNVTLRHAHKIRLGAGVIVDDNAVLDAKGDGNRGITLGDGVFVGRNTILYCKGGDIVVGDRVSFSANCQVASTRLVEVGADTVVGFLQLPPQRRGVRYRQRHPLRAPERPACGARAARRPQLLDRGARDRHRPGGDRRALRDRRRRRRHPGAAAAQRRRRHPRPGRADALRRWNPA